MEPPAITLFSGQSLLMMRKAMIKDQLTLKLVNYQHSLRWTKKWNIW